MESDKGRTYTTEPLQATASVIFRRWLFDVSKAAAKTSHEQCLSRTLPPFPSLHPPPPSPSYKNYYVVKLETLSQPLFLKSLMFNVALRPNPHTQPTTVFKTAQVQRCFTSTQTIKTVRDGEPRTATSTFTQVRRPELWETALKTHLLNNY